MIIVTTTTDSREHAHALSQALLGAKLAACVQISSVESHYHWKGSIERADEWLLTMKTRDTLFSEIEKTIKELHHYETPQIVATAILSGSEEYLEWIDSSVQASSL